MDTKKVHRSPAEGSPRGKPYDLSHSPSGRLIGKFRDNNSVTLSATVDMAYGYCDDYQPHAVKRMFDYNSGMLYDMRWDEAGNLGQVSIAKLGDMFEAGRFLFWTEDNRMHTAVDDKYYSYYAYDHSGERRLKLTGDNKLLDVNADFMATYTILNEPTLYPSAYMVLTNKGYTKHYYAGTERVAARLGGGGLDALYHVIGNDEELQVKADMLFKQSLEQVNHRVLHENDLDCIMQNEFSKEEFGYWIDGIPYQMKADVEIDHGQFKDMVNSMLDDINHGQEKEVYFYHSDHLGSASWITDVSGVAVQHIQYLPYGEPYINQHPFGYSERFTFTGKERDEETGYGYFGARYMDHELMTMWLSVDPMADKYPGISPYAYCAWNPVKLVDPDGNDWYVPKGQSTPIFDKNVTSNNCPEGATYIGKTAHWFGQTENDMQYYYHGAEDGSLSKQDMTVTIYGNKDGCDSHYGILDGVSDYYSSASTAWRNAKNKDKSKSLYTLKKNGMLGTAKPGQTKRGLDKFAKTTGKRIGRLGVVGSAVDITYSVYLDGGSFGENTSGSVGAAAGGWIGAKAGATIGGGIGSFICPGIGTAIGAGIGAIFGGISGGLGGDAVGKKIYKWTR